LPPFVKTQGFVEQRVLYGIVAAKAFLNMDFLEEFLVVIDFIFMQNNFY
jgi:hypothetical protein